MVYFNNFFFFFFYFILVFLFFIYFFLKLFKEYRLSNKILINFLLINSFFFFISIGSSPIEEAGGSLSLVLSFKNINFFSIICCILLIFFLFYTFYSLVPVAGGFIHLLVAIFSFFFMVIYLFITESLVDSLVMLEFLTISVFFFSLISLVTPKLSSSFLKYNFGFNIRYSSGVYLFTSLLNFFFLMFLLTILFFSFFLWFYYLNLGVNSMRDLIIIGNFYKKEFWISIFFFFFFFLKLGGTPAHLWKFEIFFSLKLKNLLYYSVIYLFIFFLVLVFLVISFLVLDSKLSLIFLFFVLLANTVFVIFNTLSVLDLRHFLILSTLINSSLFILALIFLKEASLNFFLGFFFNYILTSFLLFIYLDFFNKNLRFISDLSGGLNAWVVFFFFVFPLLSLSGAAPSLGFFFKFFFLVNSWVYSNFFVFGLIILSLVYTVVFYFQFFKNIFWGQVGGSLQKKCSHKKFWKSFRSQNFFFCLFFGLLLLFFFFFFFTIIYFLFSVYTDFFLKFLFYLALITSAKVLSYAISVGAFGSCAIAVSNIFASFIRAAAQFPGRQDDLWTFTLIGVALVETFFFITLLIILLVFFV